MDASPDVLAPVDSAAVLEAATELTEAGSDFAQVACTSVRRLVPSTTVTFNEVATATGLARLAVDPPEWEERLRALQDVWNELSHQNPLLAHYRSTGDTRTLRYEDVPGGDRVTESELFQRFYGPLGLRHQLALQLPSHESIVAAIVCNRDGPAYSLRDVAVLDALRPHLVMGYQSSSTMSMLTETVSSDGWLVVLVENGVVVEVSGHDASRTFVVGEPSPYDAGVVDHADHPVASHATATLDLGSVRWMVRATPGIGGPSILLARRLHDVDEAPSLSPRESGVLAELADGGTNAELARRLGISEATVRKHLENIFRALGVDNRAAAIAWFHRRT